MTFFRHTLPAISHLTAIILTLLVLLSPTPTLRSSVSLVSVTPVYESANGTTSGLAARSINKARYISTDSASPHSQAKPGPIRARRLTAERQHAVLRLRRRVPRAAACSVFPESCVVAPSRADSTSSWWKREPIGLDGMPATIEVKGPRVWVGPLGSSSSTEAGKTACQTPSFSPSFDYSVLPVPADAYLPASLKTPPALFLVAILLSFLGLCACVFASLPAYSPSISGRPKFAALSLWSRQGGVLLTAVAFVFGLAASAALHVQLGKAVDAFNGADDTQGFQASTSNGFIILWVSLVFTLIPIASSIFHLLRGAQKA